MATDTSKLAFLNISDALIDALWREFLATLDLSLVKGGNIRSNHFNGILTKAEGKPFDPNFHEAVQQVDSPTLPPGSVAAVYQRGYIHTTTNRLLRPAMVAVVRGKAEAGGDSAGKQPN